MLGGPGGLAADVAGRGCVAEDVEICIEVIVALVVFCFVDSVVEVLQLLLDFLGPPVWG